ncbi:MAG: bifunctional precorrin-2 dehydrogenase/sirohydrochlorin ferrochelatase [Phaeodactylibacter sp.]|nr:bifunctional precorrin-2 dehydrogenase/sirohydrochlorin ferrochelatase [Phaeodactylibacter sp.]
MNQLYPVFLKMDRLPLLLVGGGRVALEKLTFLLKSSPNAQVRLVAKAFIPEVLQLIEQHCFDYCQKAYECSDLDGVHLVVGATDDPIVNAQIYEDARHRALLVNIADNPPLCDFYMGGIVTKGHLKIAISTNGKSPTMAKRLRQFFEATLPDSFDELLLHLNTYRKSLRQDFEQKVETLNQLTKSFIEK